MDLTIVSATAIETQLRNKAKELLEKEEVKAVIGWGAGWNPAKASPLFVRDAASADGLIFNSFCYNNLAVYLPRINEKVALVTKPCELASVIALVAEGKIDRNNVYIIGVSCAGTIDPSKLAKAVGSTNEAVRAIIEGDSVVIDIAGQNGDTQATRVPFKDVALDACTSCKQDMQLADGIIADEANSANNISITGEMLVDVPKDADAAWWRAFWAKEFDKCLRCYACREACPACYCRDNCAVQALREKWTGATINPAEAMMFHAQRAMHVAGRCTECGACERACPVGIPLTLLHKQFGKAVRKLFNFNVGEKADLRPPLEAFQKEEL